MTKPRRRKPRQSRKTLPRFSGVAVQPPEPVQTIKQLAEETIEQARELAPQTPDPSLPPIGEGPRKPLLIVVQVPSDWERRLDMQWVVEREVAADRWNWSWPETTARITRRVCWPATWWDHVKEDLFPTWALARWPVRFEEKTWFEEVPVDCTPVPIVRHGIFRVKDGSTIVHDQLVAAVQHSDKGYPIGIAIEGGMTE